MPQTNINEITFASNLLRKHKIIASKTFKDIMIKSKKQYGLADTYLITPSKFILSGSDISDCYKTHLLLQIANYVLLEYGMIDFERYFKILDKIYKIIKIKEHSNADE
jgi:hypothetical protein